MAAFRTSAAGGSSSGTSNRTATITPAVGDLFIVTCSVDTNTNDTPTCSDNNGGTYDLIDVAAFGASAHRMSRFVRTAFLPNTTSTVVTVATGSNTAGNVVIEAFSGMNKAGIAAIRSKGKQANQAAAGTPAPALNQSALTTNPTTGAVANSTNAATMTAPTSWTERQDVGQTSNAVGLEVVTRDSGFTGTTVTWGSTSASAFASMVVELDGSFNGSLATTFGAVTVAGTGTSPIQASASITFGDVTIAGTAQAIEKGTLGTTFGDVTASGTGTAPVQAVGGFAFGDVTIAGTGTVVDNGIHGTLSTTFDDIAVAGVATAPVQAAGGFTFGDVAIAGTATAPVQASASITFGDVTASGTGTAPVAASAGFTFDDVAAAGSATAPVQASGGFTFGDVSAAGVGTAPVQASASITFGDVTVAGAGTNKQTTTAQLNWTVDPITCEGAGASLIRADLSTTFGDVAVAGTGTAPVSASLSCVFDDVSLVATGVVLVSASLALTFGAITCAGAGGGAPNELSLAASSRAVCLMVATSRRASILAPSTQLIS